MVKRAVSTPQPNWLFVAVLAILVAVVFYQPFLGSICIAAVIAYLFTPLFKWLSGKMPRKLASGLTVAISFVIIFLPVAIILILSVSQGIAFAKNLSTLSSEPGSLLQTSTQPVTDGINRLLAPANGGNPVVTQEELENVAKRIIPSIIQAATTAAVNFAANLPGLMTSIIVYAFLLNSFLLYGASARRLFMTVSPFEGETNDLYMERAGIIITGSLKGQFVIAFVTAILSSLLLIPLGLGPYFLFFVIIFTLLGMIPLGSGILMIPICIFAMLAEQFWPAFWVLLVYLLVVCNIDSLLRGRLIPKNAKLLPAITTLSTFCGIAYFGLFGIIYGPLIAILLTTTLEAYTMYRQSLVEPASRRSAKAA